MHRAIRPMLIRAIIVLATALGCASGALETQTEQPQPIASPSDEAEAQRDQRRRPRRIRRRIRRKQPVRRPAPEDPPEDAPPPVPDPLDATTKAQLLTAHNAARAQVGVGALAWSDTVAETARAWAGQLAANGCNIEHNAARTYGENLYWTTAPKNGTEVTAAWTAEAADYDAQNHACADGKICGHYTQVVWAATTKLGCGMASCGSTQVWVCNYDPPGNVQGQDAF